MAGWFRGKNTWGCILLSVARQKLESVSQPAPFSIRICCLRLVNPSWGVKKKGNKQNTQWVKQNKKLILEWTLFFSSLGRAQDLSWKQVLFLCVSQSTAPTCLCWGQDLAPSLASSFFSSSSCSLPGFNTGHA